MIPDINLFPVDSVGVSLTTTVWVGVMVVVFFNLRFGWTLSGLVVPGYLVPLILCKPMSAGLIFCEAVLTFWIVYLVSEGPRRLPHWCSFFGRDRFLALIIGSVIVRAVLEGWLLPWLGPHVNEFTGLQIDYRNDLHSYGLIIVSLMANYFWKPGLIRGGASLITSVAITYLIVRYPLIEFTNLNVADVSNLYDDISTSLLASPKAYMVILTSALIASWLNLKYSWDYNGILVPSLLALLWHDPMKIFASFFEAGFLLCLASLLLRLPMFKKMTVEGARRTAVFFTICFVYRLLLSHICQTFWPSVQVTDLFGFGYLLTTLLAIKAHQKKLTARLVKATAQASALGAVIGNGLGFAMTLLPMHWLVPAALSAEIPAATAIQQTDRTLAEVLGHDKLLLYSQKTPGSYAAPLFGETSSFRSGVEALAKHIRSRDPRDLESANRRLRAANYDVTIVGERYVYLRERERNGESVKGWGLYIFDMQQPDGLLVDVPYPLDEGTLDSGLCLFQKLGGSVLAVGGTGRETNSDRSSDVLTNRKSLLSTFHQALPAHGVLQVRARTGAKQSSKNGGGSENVANSKTTVWVHQRLPRGVNLKHVKSLTSDFDVRWSPLPAKNVVRELPHDGFAELWLAEQDLQSLVPEGRGRTSSAVAFLDQPLNPFLMHVRDQIAEKNTDLYQPARTEELLLMDEEVLGPLMRFAANWTDATETGLRQTLRPIASAAQILDYQVTVLRDANQNQSYLILHEGAQPQRYWGTFVFRQGLASSSIVEAPRPLLERQSLEFAASLFEQLDASALFIGGSHPAANRDGSSDLARRANKANAFNLVHQSFLREMGERPMLVVQSRSIRSPVDADIVMACENGATAELMSPLKQRLRDSLRQLGMRVEHVDGSELMAGYEVGILLQATSLNQSRNKELVSLWVSPEMRGRYQTLNKHVQIQAQLESLGIPTIGDNLLQFVNRQGQRTPHANRPAVSSRPILTEIMNGVNEYLTNRDIVRLASVLAHHPNCHFGAIVDQTTAQIYLAVKPANQRLPWVVNLTGSVGDFDRIVQSDWSNIDALREYLNSRAAWLEIQGGER